MKYCPYCGADFADGAASFCMECGKSLPTAEGGQKKPKEKPVKSQKRMEKKRKHPSPKPRKKHEKPVGEHVGGAFHPKEDGYDGYYDDVLPSDAGKLKEGPDMELVKKVSAVAGVMLLIVILCVVAMYTFSDLYHQPKTIADIVLDMVIMAPEMIRPLDDLRSMRKRVNVFLVMEDWAVNGEHGNDCEAFSDYDDAKRIMTNRIREELEDGSVPSWRESTIFAENSSMDLYEAYLDGEYMENHYKIMIIRQPLMMSSRYIREVGGVYKAQCQTEDFISQIEQWDEVAALSDAQYQRLITNPMIPECIERHLGRNDHYWEAYWESVSEAAHGLVRQASKQPDCFTPEAENPYPLCIGSGKSECDDCCLYMHMKGEGGYEC